MDATPPGNDIAGLHDLLLASLLNDLVWEDETDVREGPGDLGELPPTRATFDPGLAA